MKKNLLISLLIIVTGSAIVASLKAQDKPLPPKYEYATVKWDGPDRLYYNLPNKFEMVHLEKIGIQIPPEAEKEEYCLAVASNIMAKDGWEPVNLDSRRILYRRATK
ncbi:MAG: hypothetical protein JWQ04_2461 [Pedosphaera sp.]|nr:hypothetical protein [Pedosphaera sp.]